MNNTKSTPIGSYLNRNDWRVKANANQGFSIGGLASNISGKEFAEYWLDHIYPTEAKEYHQRGSLHIHDLDLLSPYCMGWSLKDLIQEGFNGVGGKIEASPAKHLSSILGQMVNFLGTLQNEWAGAQAFNSFDTFIAPFIKIDNISYETLKQELQEFLFCLNVCSRWGFQTVFSNLSFDIIVPDDMKNEYPIIGEQILNFTYGDCQVEMNMINKAYLELMTTGDSKGRIFTFPIPTYNITKDFDWNSEIADMICEMTAKTGAPYFQNFVNSDLKPEDIRSFCCRLQLRMDDLKKLRKRGGGLFGSNTLTGSIGVITINCAQLGYLAKNNKEALYTRLDTLLELSKNILESKRVFITEQHKNGLYPYTRRYLKTFDNHFSTIGVNGINEMIRNFTNDKDNITTKTGKAFAEEILTYIRTRLVTFQEETKNPYNLEATPAEGTTYRFAREDKKQYKDIIQAGTPDAPYYTNSTQLPANSHYSLFEALKHQEKLQSLYSGGSVFHIYTHEALDGKATKLLLKKTIENFKIPYISLTPTFSVCPTHGKLQGLHEVCDECGQETEIWTRVMGYYRPIESFNSGKKSEYNERNFFGANLN